MPSGSCPNRAELFAYLVGDLAEPRASLLDDHVAACQACQAELSTIDDSQDALVSNLRQGTASADEVSRLGLLISQLARLRPDQPSSSRELPKIVGDYEIIKQLGSGGGGVVYLARHPQLGRLVALKVLTAARLDQPQAQARFRREMLAAAKLDDPHIVRATDAGFDAGQPYLVMDYVAGLSIGEIANHCGRLMIADACEIARQTALGLSAAHAAGIVHRDIKPTNLILGQDGRVRILDMGLARFQQPVDDEELTASGHLVGTAGYLAPEQALDGGSADARSDLYSLGATLYRLLAGHGPFSGQRYDTSLKKVVGHVRDEPPPLNAERPEVPRELAAAVHRMLEKSPDRRPKSAGDVVALLTSFCKDARLVDLLRRCETETPSNTNSEVGGAGAWRVPELAPPHAVRRAVSPRTWLLALAMLGILASIPLLRRLTVGTPPTLANSTESNGGEEAAEEVTATNSPSVPLQGTLQSLTKDAAAMPPLTGMTEFRLPHKYSAVTMGGGGRYLAFLVPDPGRVLLFDVLTRKMVAELPVGKPGDLIVASRQKLLVISPDSMMISSWDLQTRKRLRVMAIAGGDTPRRAALGSGGDGPLLLGGEKAQLIDLETLKPLPTKGPLIGGADRGGYFLRAACDGKSFAGITGARSGSPYQVLQLDGLNTAINQMGNMDGIPRWVSLTADGSLLLGNANVFRASGRPVIVKAFDAAGIPTVDPRYFLTLNMGDGKTLISVYSAADCELLLTERGFEELVPKQISSWHSIVPAMLAQETWRVQYLPWANAIVTLPPENDRIILRPFNLDKMLKNQGTEYLFTESIPPQVAYLGEELRYQVRAHAIKGKVTFIKEDGPPGLKVSPNGKVEWRVPDTFSESFVRIIIRLRDTQRNEAFHSFELVVRPRVIVKEG